MQYLHTPLCLWLGCLWAVISISIPRKLLQWGPCDMISPNFYSCHSWWWKDLLKQVSNINAIHEILNTSFCSCNTNGINTTKAQILSLSCHHHHEHSENTAGYQDQDSSANIIMDTTAHLNWKYIGINSFSVKLERSLPQHLIHLIESWFWRGLLVLVFSCLHF